MKEEAHCLLCDKAPTHCQSILAISREDGGITQCEFYACSACKSELQRAIQQDRKLNAILIALWSLVMLALIVFVPLIALACLVPSLIVLAGIHWLRRPLSLKRANKYLEQRGKTERVNLQALGEFWRALSPDDERGGCSRCQSKYITHQCEIEGLSFAKSTEKVVMTTNTYAVLRCPVPLCERCAGDLERCMGVSRLVRWSVPSIIAFSLAWAIKDPRNMFLTNGGYRPSPDLVEMGLLFLIFFVILYLFARLATRRFIEFPWIERTEARQQLGAQGCGRTQVNIVSRPTPVPVSVKN